eukprot:Ihof_evm1s564 gene=Ihof_evmTU1s564
MTGLTNRLRSAGDGNTSGSDITLGSRNTEGIGHNGETFKYSKEVMLSFYDKDAPMAPSLHDYILTTDIVSESTLTPMAHIPMTEEEDRALHNVNSSRLSGSSSRSRGRGRGRGRGDGGSYDGDSNRDIGSRRHNINEGNGGYNLGPISGSLMGEGMRTGGRERELDAFNWNVTSPMTPTNGSSHYWSGDDNYGDDADLSTREGGQEQSIAWNARGDMDGAAVFFSQKSIGDDKDDLTQPISLTRNSSFGADIWSLGVRGSIEMSQPSPLAGLVSADDAIIPPSPRRLDSPAIAAIAPSVGSGSRISSPLPVLTSAATSPLSAVPMPVQWFYKDPFGKLQGPFTNETMLIWYKEGFFSSDLLVQDNNMYDFVSLGQLFIQRGSNPFLPQPMAQTLPVAHPPLLATLSTDRGRSPPPPKPLAAASLSIPAPTSHQLGSVDVQHQQHAQNIFSGMWGSHMDPMSQPMHQSMGLGVDPLTWQYQQQLGAQGLYNQLGGHGAYGLAGVNPMNSMAGMNMNIGIPFGMAGGLHSGIGLAGQYQRMASVDGQTKDNDTPKLDSGWVGVGSTQPKLPFNQDWLSTLGNIGNMGGSGNMQSMNNIDSITEAIDGLCMTSQPPQPPLPTLPTPLNPGDTSFAPKMGFAAMPSVPFSAQMNASMGAMIGTVEPVPANTWTALAQQAASAGLATQTSLPVEKDSPHLPQDSTLAQPEASSKPEEGEQKQIKHKTQDLENQQKDTSGVTTTSELPPPTSSSTMPGKEEKRKEYRRQLSAEITKNTRAPIPLLNRAVSYNSIPSLAQIQLAEEQEKQKDEMQMQQKSEQLQQPQQEAIITPMPGVPWRSPALSKATLHSEPSPLPPPKTLVEIQQEELKKLKSKDQALAAANQKDSMPRQHQWASGISLPVTPTLSLAEIQKQEEMRVQARAAQDDLQRQQRLNVLAQEAEQAHTPESISPNSILQHAGWASRGESASPAVAAVPIATIVKKSVTGKPEESVWGAKESPIEGPKAPTVGLDDTDLMGMTKALSKAEKRRNKKANTKKVVAAVPTVLPTPTPPPIILGPVPAIRESAARKAARTALEEETKTFTAWCEEQISSIPSQAEID